MLRKLWTLLLGLACLAAMSTPADAATGSGAVDLFYAKASCTNNGDGLAQTCAASAGTSGAFNSFANIIWTATTGVDDGDTLYVCGQHATPLNAGASAAGTAALPITIDFRCPSDAGSIRIIRNMTEALVQGNWTNESTNIWYLDVSAYDSSGRNPRRVWIDSVEVFPAFSKDQLGTHIGTEAPLSVFWPDSVNFRIYFYSAANPATTYSLFETLNGMAGTCYYAAMCFGQVANQYFEVINPNLQGGNNSALFMPGPGYIHVYGTAADDSACHIGAYSMRGVIIADDTATNGTGTVSSHVRIHDCTFDPIHPANFKGYTEAWDQGGNGDAVDLFYGTNSNTITSNTFKNWGHCFVCIVATLGTTAVTDNMISYNTMICEPFASYCRAFGMDGAALDRATRNYFLGNTVNGQSARSQFNGNGNYMIGNRFKNMQLSSVLGSHSVPSPLGYASQFVTMQGYAGPSQDNVILRNTFENNSYGPCLQFEAHATNPTSGFLVQDNTFIGCNGTYVTGLEYTALAIVNSIGVGNNTFKGNRFFTSGYANKILYKATGLTTVAGFEAACSGDVCNGNVALTGSVSSNRTARPQ